MKDRNAVLVFKYADRTHLVLVHFDPITGRRKTRSAKTSNKKEAERAAAAWENELRQGIYTPSASTNWKTFRTRYELEELSGKAENTRDKCDVVFDAVERVMNPRRVNDITSERVSWLAAELRKDRLVDGIKRAGLAEDSIQTHMNHLRAALRWAERIGMIAKAPLFPKLHRAKGDSMKGRAPAGEEFERLLGAIPNALCQGKRATHVSLEHVPEWIRYLKGLWFGGWRLAESLELSWEPGSPLEVDLSGKYPVVLIAHEGQKSFKQEILPIAPEFADILLATPKKDRHGFVFNPIGRYGRRVNADSAMRWIARFGKAVNVKTWTSPKSGAVKFVSAHDLRRAFGLRWSSRVMPPVLQQMMRHSSIATTMKYYVGRDAQTASGVIWDAYRKLESSNTLSNSPDFRRNSPRSKRRKTSEKQ